MTKQRIKKPTVIRNIKSVTEPQIEQEIEDIKKATQKIADELSESEQIAATEKIELEKTIEQPIKPKVPVKMWVRQEPVLVDADPTVSTTVQMLLDENKVLAEQHAKNQHAIQMLTKGVLKYYEISTPNLAAVKFRKTDGVGQFVIPQPDKLIEK